MSGFMDTISKPAVLRTVASLALFCGLLVLLSLPTLGVAACVSFVQKALLIIFAVGLLGGIGYFAYREWKKEKRH